MPLTVQTAKDDRSRWVVVETTEHHFIADLGPVRSTALFASIVSVGRGARFNIGSVPRPWRARVVAALGARGRYLGPMPELPDITVYIEALERHALGQPLRSVTAVSPFVLRTVDPPLSALDGLEVTGFRRIGKRIVFCFAPDLFLVIHLMVAGRLQWHVTAPKLNRKLVLASFVFDSGTLLLTEAGSKKRASIFVVRGEEALREFDRGGIEILSCDLALRTTRSSARSPTRACSAVSATHIATRYCTAPSSRRSCSPRK